LGLVLDQSATGLLCEKGDVSDQVDKWSVMCACRCLQHIRELLDILTTNSDTIVAREHIAEETENDKFTKVSTAYIWWIWSLSSQSGLLAWKSCPAAEVSVAVLQGPPYYIRGCMLTIVERMDEEFIKMLQACDAHSTEYIVRW